MRRKLTAFRLDKIAAVDSPCQEHATVAIIKRNPNAPDTSPKAIAKATFQEALEGNMIAGAVNDAFYSSFDGLWERNDAFRTALTDELSEGGDGSTASADYVESVKALVDEAVTEARSAGATAADTKGIDKALNAAVNKWLKPKEQAMNKITTKAALLAAVAKFDPETSTVAEAETIRKAATALKAEDLLPDEGPLAKAKLDPEIAKMQRELVIIKLSPEAKTHFDSLDETGQTEFLGKSADEQTQIVAKANETDPVVYTTKDGTAIRKSDGAAMVALAKQNDQQADKIAKLEGDATGQSFEKRAAEDYPHVAKAIATDMLKSAHQVGEDTDSGKAILSSLGQLNKTSTGLFKRMGASEDDAHRGAPEGIAKARATFDGKVAEVAKRDGIAKSAAMPIAREEFPDEFAEAYPDTVEAVEESAEAARAEAQES